jgi:hypothetical protein
MGKQHTLFPTAIVFPSGLQQMFIFSPLVLTTFTHLPAEEEHLDFRYSLNFILDSSISAVNSSS